MQELKKTSSLPHLSLDTILKVAWFSLFYSLSRKQIREVVPAIGLTGNGPSSSFSPRLEPQAKPKLALCLLQLSAVRVLLQRGTFEQAIVILYVELKA